MIENLIMALQKLCEHPQGNVREMIQLQKEIDTLLKKQPEIFSYILPENESERCNEPPNQL